ncbi:MULTISPECIES: TonB-dependent receptor [unclassified Lysobacter]|uniref:TonB-dependent receptor n=1 Tax=unclassified Lysobacter TaxID=2635362 RepID=UPI001BEC6999|nr:MULTISPECIES: TonB-dependent receptor [unclassified Lysobacter]MBT2746271.1 TonB-dependent receptor [Lysobacter sp. ISL-42]MBT2751256.1 TonB-dependent receptor [Lysobacter sp. ISL-50]MBT2775664.1 TonB-dependent receptor [Lysobacter sp. ISL-54]MBT2780049.1 TonB-dependent receptor [Lysobacter sp. ISL-52]
MAKIAYAFIVSVALTFSPVAGALQAPEGDIPADGYNIPPGALDDALNAFASRNRLQLIYAPALVARRRSAGLKGRPGIREGLAQLLDGTGLTAVAVKANVYLLQPAPRPRPRPVPQAFVQKPQAMPKAPTTTELDTVHVTGTRIGRAAFESSLPLTLITNEQIRASGHQTLFDLLRLTPGMTGHHPRNVATEGGASQVPSAAAASASLYSLGPRATLFLVDGRRMANYGLVSTDMGALTDLNGIPLSMVDHIEIAHGGASAIYGADAMAGVVNIILKKDYRGAEVGGSYGVSQRGDAEQQREYASFGEQTPGGGSVFVSIDHFTRNPLIGSQREWSTLDQRRYGLLDGRIPSGFDDFEAGGIRAVNGCKSRDKTARGIDCSLDIPQYVSLQPGITSNAFYTHFRQPIGENAEFYADLRATRVGLEMQNAPFYASVNLPEDHPDAYKPKPYLDLNYWFSEVGPVRNRTVTSTRDFTAGLKGYRDKWEWDVSLSRRRNKVVNRIDGLINEPAINAEVKTFHFNKTEGNAPEVLDEISPQVTMGGQMILDTASASIEGPLFALPAGDVQIAAGVETRRERLSNRPDQSFVQGNVALAQQLDEREASRNTSAIYGEVNVPLHDKLWVDAAWRLDHNGGYGNQISPMFGVRWQPWQSLILRASMGEGYRAPTLAELRRPLVIDSEGYVRSDPSTQPCLIDLGPVCMIDRRATINADLRPETSTSRSLGLIWTPSEDFTATVNRYRIRRRNEILAIDAVSRPDLFPKAMVRDEEGYLIAVDTYLDNIGSTEVSGWEIDTEYRLQTQRRGNFAFRLNGHYMDRLLRRPHPAEKELDYSGFGTPNRTVLGSVRWTYRDWIATLNLRYMGPATVWITEPGQTCPTINGVVGRCRTPSATLLGMDLAYGGFDKWLIGLNVSNLNDRRPVNYDYSYGGYSIVDDDPVGRYYLVSAMYRF